MNQRMLEEPHFYNPQNYMNYEDFTLAPLETVIILLNISDIVCRLNICCGKVNAWSNEAQLCLLVVNKSTSIPVYVEKSSALVHLLSSQHFDSQLAVIPVHDLIKLSNCWLEEHNTES